MYPGSLLFDGSISNYKYRHDKLDPGWPVFSSRLTPVVVSDLADRFLGDGDWLLSTCVFAAAWVGAVER